MIGESTMKKVLTIILLISFVVCLTACGNTAPNSLSEEQVREIVQGEIAKNDVATENEFKIGDKLLNPLGDNFKLPINGQENQFATITKLEVTNKKEADASNLKDYWQRGSNYYFSRYIYEVVIEGNVDKKFAGKEIYINLQFESYNGFFDAGGAGAATVKDDGTFVFQYLAYSNVIEKVIIPHSVAINMF